MSNYKLAIVMRADLEMSTAKMCVQAEHASVYAFLACIGRVNGGMKATKWWYEGQYKVVLQVHGLKELEDLANNAYAKNLPVTHVTDFGLTQAERAQAVPKTMTCIAIGPDLSERVDQATKGLKLVQFI